MHSDDDARSVDRATQHDGTSRPDSIEVRSNDQTIALLQLAARWSEFFARQESNPQQAVRDYFRLAFNYLDAVVHGIEPPETRRPT